ncbi:hypothetical protein F5Y16DRAFT_189766 [Xylariaceae sp. FL0255]|nr:hypothetical protein F5Y16DRAFT_189766 [Xylariaceae sp. FL0255]
MSPGLRPLWLPSLVEQRRKQEEELAAAAATPLVTAGEVSENDAYTYHLSQQYRQSQQPRHSASSDVTSPVTPGFSPRGHLRYSSSMSSFDLATSASLEDLPSSPTHSVQTPGKRILDDVQEEPFEYDRFNHLDIDVDEIDVAYDDVSEHYDLYDCLCTDPCLCRVQSATSFYTRGRESSWDSGCMSDGESSVSHRLSRKTREPAVPPLMGLSYKLTTRFPSITRWRSPRKSSTVSSPGSDGGLGSPKSHAASSRSSSRSASRHVLDRSNEPPLPPTPALSFLESSDSITLPGPLDVDEADHILVSIQRQRAQATTPLLPPLMTSNLDTIPATSQPSPLQSPTIVSPAIEEPQSPLVMSPPLMMSPPLSTKPSVSSFRQMIASGELPPNPDSDGWSDRLGHANFTITPIPYRPDTINLASLQELQAEWEMARCNYTKHLVRTGEHYGLTSKTYGYTEEKWAEIERAWRGYHDEIAEALVANGEVSSRHKFDENVIVPVMDGEGKFPERGDEDIVGPMVREATMSPIAGNDRKRPSFWRHLSDRVGLRK